MERLLWVPCNKLKTENLEIVLTKRTTVNPYVKIAQEKVLCPAPKGCLYNLKESLELRTSARAQTFCKIFVFE